MSQDDLDSQKERKKEGAYSQEEGGEVGVFWHMGGRDVRMWCVTGAAFITRCHTRRESCNVEQEDPECVQNSTFGQVDAALRPPLSPPPFSFLFGHLQTSLTHRHMNRQDFHGGVQAHPSALVKNAWTSHLDGEKREWQSSGGRDGAEQQRTSDVSLR